jgi:splicing factor 45
MVAVWDPLEQYDPLRPNDYNEFKVWKQKDRIDKRERLAEQRRMEDLKRNRRSNSYSDSEGTGSEDERPRKTGLFSYSVNYFSQCRWFHAGRYHDCYDHWSRADDERRGFGSAPAQHDHPPVMVDRNLTGDEAFQRRLALSASIRPRSPLPAAPAPASSSHAEDEDEDTIPGLSMGFAPSPPPLAESGEEAYLRRVAMSTVVRPPQTLPVVSPPSPPILAYNPFAPPSAPPPPPGPPGVVPGAFEDRAKAAAAIAAKLGALVAATGSASVPVLPTPAPHEDDTSSKRSVHISLHIFTPPSSII